MTFVEVIGAMYMILCLLWLVLMPVVIVSAYYQVMKK